MLEGRAEGLPGARIPQARGPVRTRGDDAGAVRAEARANHRALMLEGRPERQNARVSFSIAQGNPEGTLGVLILRVVADGAAKVGGGFLPFALGEPSLSGGGIRAAGFL